MRKKMLVLVFAAALVVAMAVPLFGGTDTASAGGKVTGHVASCQNGGMSVMEPGEECEE